MNNLVPLLLVILIVVLLLYSVCAVLLYAKTGMSCQWYRFKPTLQEDMARADTVISHAGAGSVMEALGKHPALRAYQHKCYNSINSSVYGINSTVQYL